MAGLELLRLAKFLSVAVFVVGAVACLLPSLSLAQRRVFAYRYAGLGFGATWLAGIVLAAANGLSLLAPHVLATMFASILTLNGVLYVAGREGRVTPGSQAFVLVTLAACFALMVLRPRFGG